MIPTDRIWRKDWMVWLSVGRLAQLWNPFEVTGVFQLESAITLKEISCAIACEQFERHPLPDRLINLENPGRDYHIGRIAWLVVRGWHDPIWLDVGCPSFGYSPDWAIGDGNHRLAAAIYRGDRMIACEIAGEQEAIDALLPDQLPFHSQFLDPIPDFSLNLPL